MKKTILGLTLLALAVPLTPSFAQQGGVPAVNAQGSAFRAVRASGRLLDPAGNQGTNPSLSASTTLDAVDFGFMTDYVSLCIYPSDTVVPQPIYFRFGTTASQSPASLTTATDAHLTAPASTSAAFINGDSNTRQSHAAFVISAPASDTTARGLAPLCQMHPWRTRGLVVHIVSGQATIDVSGFADERGR